MGTASSQMRHSTVTAAPVESLKAPSTSNCCAGHRPSGLASISCSPCQRSVIMSHSYFTVGRPCVRSTGYRRRSLKLKRPDPSNRRFERAPQRLNGLFGGNKDNNGDGTKNPFSNFSELLKKAQDAQVRASVEAQKVQEELSKVEYDGYDREELVRVVLSGNQEPRSVELTESLLDLELDEIEERIFAAMKEAHSKSVEGMKHRMQQLYSELGFPMPPQP